MCNEQRRIGSEKGGDTGKGGKLKTERANGLRLAISCYLYTIRGRQLLAHASRRADTALKSTLVNTTILNDYLC
jgi:isopentenyldiphosphate isomerase